MHIHEHVAHAAAAAHLLLVIRFKSTHTDHVTRLVVRILLHLLGVHLAEVTQQVCSGMGRVGAQRSRLTIEAGVLVQVHTDRRELVGRDLLLDDARLVLRVACRFAEAGAEVPFGHTDQTAEPGCVEGLHFLGHHHEVVHRRIGHEQSFLAVVDQAARGVHGHLPFGHVGGLGLPLPIHHLDPEEAKDEDDADEQHPTDEDVFAALVVHRRSRSLPEVRNWASRQSPKVNTALSSARRKVPKKASKRCSSIRKSQTWWSKMRKPA